MERDFCEFICGAPTTFQGYGVEKTRIKKKDVGKLAKSRKLSNRRRISYYTASHSLNDCHKKA